ncbi:hypothetical protein Q7O_002036 [Pectobacterium carotovorum subsp. carotovorum PCCS1]|nr:hypothetical protein [Pectobacterium carotovorum subsp. carotovorum PCCS1]
MNKRGSALIYHEGNTLAVYADEIQPISGAKKGSRPWRAPWKVDENVMR